MQACLGTGMAWGWATLPIPCLSCRMGAQDGRYPRALPRPPAQVVPSGAMLATKDNIRFCLCGLRHTPSDYAPRQSSRTRRVPLVIRQLSHRPAGWGWPEPGGSPVGTAAGVPSEHPFTHRYWVERETVFFLDGPELPLPSVYEAGHFAPAVWTRGATGL